MTGSKKNNASGGNAAPCEFVADPPAPAVASRNLTSSDPEPWRAADAAFVEIEIHRPSYMQMHVDYGCGLRLVITDSSQVPLAASLIESLRTTGKETLQ